LDCSTCAASDSASLTGTFKDSLFSVVATLVEVLHDVGRSFLRGFRSTGRSCVCDTLPNYRCGSFPNIPNQPIDYRRDDVCGPPKNTPNRQGFSRADYGTDLCRAVTFFWCGPIFASTFACFPSTRTYTDSTSTEKTCDTCTSSTYTRRSGTISSASTYTYSTRDRAKRLADLIGKVFLVTHAWSQRIGNALDALPCSEFFLLVKHRSSAECSAFAEPYNPRRKAPSEIAEEARLGVLHGD
jgi:hypothetical protein